MLAQHRRVLREAWQRHGGIEVDTQGDAFFVAFARASDALAAAERGPGSTRSTLLSVEGPRGTRRHEFHIKPLVLPCFRDCCSNAGRGVVEASVSQCRDDHALDRQLRDPFSEASSGSR